MTCRLRQAAKYCFLAAFLLPPLSGAPPTYTKDVAPLLQKNCQVCHRPGEAGPFSMLSYGDTRPWAAAIKQALKTGKMPPWFADPHYGKFSNATALSQSEIDTIVAWVDAGAPQGDPRDLPSPAHFFEGWQIGKPDLVFELPKPFIVPTSGVVDYQHIIVHTGFTKDTWVQAAEVRPTDRAIVHHIIAFIREPDSNWFRGQKVGEFFLAPQVKTKAEPDASPCRAIFWLATLQVNRPRSFARARPNSSRPDPTLSSRFTTLQMENLSLT